eukprot:773299-Alexandrium_andersonii.AAC.2
MPDFLYKLGAGFRLSSRIADLPLNLLNTLPSTRVTPICRDNQGLNTCADWTCGTSHCWRCAANGIEVSTARWPQALLRGLAGHALQCSDAVPSSTKITVLRLDVGAVRHLGPVLNGVEGLRLLRAGLHLLPLDPHLLVAAVAHELRIAGKG